MKKKSLIKSIKAREILNSRGYPSLELSLLLSDDLLVKSSAPRGLRENLYGAKDLLDHDPKRYNGQGVLLAVNHVNELISSRLEGLSVFEQERIDNILLELDGTKDKRQLGANTIYAVSTAVARAAALVKRQELFQYLAELYRLKTKIAMPSPLINMFNGGIYADTNLDFQEYILIPQIDSPSFKKTSFEDAYARVIRASTEIYHKLGEILLKSGFDTDTGIEGAYAPDMDSSLQAIELILAAIIELDYSPGKDFSLGIDIGSQRLYLPETNQYIFALDNSCLNAQSLIDLYHSWLEKYPISYLEDPIASQDSWEAWREITTSLGDKLSLAGDSLFSSNINRLRQAVLEEAANTIVIKPNEIASLTETFKTIKLAKKQGYKVVISHRAQETNDDLIVDVAVAASADYIKLGAPNRGERIAKFNRLTEIASILELDNLKRNAKR